jgi:hypothetical protein
MLENGEGLVRRFVTKSILAAAAYLALAGFAWGRIIRAASSDHSARRRRRGDVLPARSRTSRKAWGQPVVVENRPAARPTSARACAESPPDGYTICVLSSEPVVYNQSLFKSRVRSGEGLADANLFNTLACHQ